MRTLSFALVGLMVSAGLPQLASARTAAAEDPHKQAAIASAELATIAKYLQSQPAMALDFSKVSGEYCLNTWKAGGGHMTHFAIDPSGTQEDVIDFMKADSLVGAGLNVSNLPRLPDKLGAMEPNQWYYQPAGGFDPHHGGPASVSLLVRASNLQ